MDIHKATISISVAEDEFLHPDLAAAGGEATHTAGQGTTYANKEGDTATHTEGSGTTTGSNAYESTCFSQRRTPMVELRERRKLATSQWPQ
jgi:hypothetical protein